MHTWTLLKNWEGEHKLAIHIFNLLSNMVLKIFLLQSLSMNQPITGVPTLEEHFLKAQDHTAPLPIWRPSNMLDCQRDDLTDQWWGMLYGLLEIYRSCLLGKSVLRTGMTRNPDNTDDGQKEKYHVGSLTQLRKNQPSAVYRLPHLVFRNGAHRVALCEATDDHGGIAAHRNLAKDNVMVGMIVNAEITAPSLAIFVRGTHEVGTSGARTEMLSTMSPNMDAAVKPHPAPIASTFWTILQIVFLKLMAYVVLCLSRQPAQTITTFIVLA